MISLTPEACCCPRIKPSPNSSPSATQHPMGDVQGMHEVRALQQRQESLSHFLDSGQHSAAAGLTAQLLWEAGCNMSVPNRRILKRSNDGLSGEP